MLKPGRYTTPSGVEYFGIKITLGGGWRPPKRDYSDIDKIINKWREEYFKNSNT